MNSSTLLRAEFVPLLEKAANSDGIIPIRIITPGWGSSGYYPAAALEKAARLYTAGMHMYWNHPTVEEERLRPERDLRDLAAVLVEGGHYEQHPVHGPGIYAKARIFGPYRDLVKEMGEHIGLSHRGTGTAKQGSAEGRTGSIIGEITAVESVDFVTQPGRGGAVLPMLEAARRQMETAADSLADTEAELCRFFQVLGLSEAEAMVATAGRHGTPTTRIRETLQSGPAPVQLTEMEREMFDFFRRLGLTEAEAMVAAAGRGGYPRMQLLEALQEHREDIKQLSESEAVLFAEFLAFGQAPRAALAAAKGRV